ncbi:hypothetical protein [Winogradskyella forsetii]|uniref:hypothetical protein n=1 Tax=Winogradskyella forsetii TaxID=2686077 RepID=UPI0015B90F44|nr:hypothetical protein [Winogradskyella forsetii]
MKVKLYLLSLMCLSVLFNCSTEQISDDIDEENYFRVTEYRNYDNSNLSRSSEQIEFCYSVNLMAGRNIYLGALGVTKTETDLIVTYATIPGWTIDETHINVGDCSEGWAPTTGSGNPKIGKFDHKEPHSTEVNRVVYHINLDAIPDDSDLYCLAAHAVVLGPNGEETAWAGGSNDGGGSIGRSNTNNGYTVMEFPGRSWATFIQSYLSSCVY